MLWCACTRRERYLDMLFETSSPRNDEQHFRRSFREKHGGLSSRIAAAGNDHCLSAAELTFKSSCRHNKRPSPRTARDRLHPIAGNLHRSQ